MTALKRIYYESGFVLRVYEITNGESIFWWCVHSQGALLLWQGKVVDEGFADTEPQATDDGFTSIKFLSGDEL